jgi:hypothetical protein
MLTGRPPGGPSAKCGPASGRIERGKVLRSEDVKMYFHDKMDLVVQYEGRI